tara:strand:+ start:14873 stop:15088 length:216 start_codon:yes stop_codon:yes gene_type:complete
MLTSKNKDTKSFNKTIDIMRKMGESQIQINYEKCNLEFIGEYLIITTESDDYLETEIIPINTVVQYRIKKD